MIYEFKHNISTDRFNQRLNDICLLCKNIGFNLISKETMNFDNIIFNEFSEDYKRYDLLNTQNFIFEDKNNIKLEINKIYIRLTLYKEKHDYIFEFNKILEFFENIPYNIIYRFTIFHNEYKIFQNIKDSKEILKKENMYYDLKNNSFKKVGIYAPQEITKKMNDYYEYFNIIIEKKFQRILETREKEVITFNKNIIISIEDISYKHNFDKSIFEPSLLEYILSILKKMD